MKTDITQALVAEHRLILRMITLQEECCSYCRRRLYRLAVLSEWS